MEFEYINGKEDIKKLLVDDVENEKSHKNLYIKNISVLNIDDIEKILSNTIIDNIYIPVHVNNIADESSNAYMSDKNKRWNTYTLDEYRSLREKVNNILSEVDENDSDIQKFTKIYRKLGENLKYATEDEADWKNRTEEQMKEHNTLRGLLTDRCVCAGYTIILNQVLACANIESKFVTNIPDRSKHPGHGWSQVKIDGKWYNCDLTEDSRNCFNENATPKYCLKSNRNPYFNSFGEQRNGEKCIDSYSIQEIEQYMFPEKMLRKKIKWFCKNQGEFKSEFLEKECENLGMDFNEELAKAKAQSEVEEEILEEISNLSKIKNAESEEGKRKDIDFVLDIKPEKRTVWIKKCKEVGLRAKDQVVFSNKILKFRSEILEHSKEDMDESCFELGLNMEYEIQLAKSKKALSNNSEIKIGHNLMKSARNIANAQMYRSIVNSSLELKEGYKEEKNPIITNDLEILKIF